MWKRTGECTQCGACCTGNPWDDPENVTRYGPQPATGALSGFCPLLTPQPDGRRICAGHGTNSYYKAACTTWPTEPCQIAPFKECTFGFEWVE